MEIWDIIYYSLSITLIFYSIYKSKIPTFSLTGIYLRILLIIIIIPGFYLYRGGVKYYEGAPINFLMYSLCFAQIIASCLCASLAWQKKYTLNINIIKRQNFNFLLNILVLIVSLYTLLYLYSFLDRIPIFKISNTDFILTGSFERSFLTHGFEKEQSILFSYYRPITKDLLFFLSLCLVFTSKNRTIAYFVLFLSVLSLIAHIEKAYAVYMILSFAAVSRLERTQTLAGELYIALGLLTTTLLSIYLFFAESWLDALEYLPLRLVAQIGYVPIQLDIAEALGPQGLAGLNLGLLAGLLGVDQVNISELAWGEVHTDLKAAGLFGSSAGLGAADLYMSLGPFGLVLLLPVIYITCVIDRGLFLSVAKLGDAEAGPGKAFYIVFISFYPLNLLGSSFGIFSIPYIFHQNLLVIILALLMLVKVRVGRSADD